MATTTFDESKHNRHQDGKFANKVHAEAAGVSLGGGAATLTSQLMALTPEQQDEMLDHLQADKLAQWAQTHEGGGGPTVPNSLPNIDMGVEVVDDLYPHRVEASLGIDATWDVTATSGGGYPEVRVDGPDDPAKALGLTEAQWEDVEAAVWEAAERGGRGLEVVGTLQPQARDTLAAYAFGQPLPKTSGPVSLDGYSADAKAKAAQQLYAGVIDRMDTRRAPTWPTEMGEKPTDNNITTEGDEVWIEGQWEGHPFTAYTQVATNSEPTSIEWIDGDVNLTDSQDRKMGFYMAEASSRAYRLHRTKGRWSDAGPDADAAARYAMGL